MCMDGRCILYLLPVPSLSCLCFVSPDVGWLWWTFAVQTRLKMAPGWHCQLWSPLCQGVSWGLCPSASVRAMDQGSSRRGDSYFCDIQLQRHGWGQQLCVHWIVVNKKWAAVYAHPIDRVPAAHFRSIRHFWMSLATHYYAVIKCWFFCHSTY